MRVDRDGNELRQVSLWLLVAAIRLYRADRLNLTQFLLDQLEILYGGEPETTATNQRSRLVEAAGEVFTKQRAAEAAAEAGRERARSAVRRLRDERDATRTRQDGIADALRQIIGDESPCRYSRMLPENDLRGNRMDDWEAPVHRVSRLCGAEIDSAEVAEGLRMLTAAQA